MTKILIELDANDENHVRLALSEVGEQDASVIEAKRFDGALLVQILASVNAVTVPILGKIIIERIRSNRHVVVKRKGVTVSGLNADNAIKVLQSLGKDD